MKSLTDKYQFKNLIKARASQLSIDGDFFDQFFSKVFLDIYEKTAKASCVLKKLEIDLLQIILDETHRVDKKNKADFLLLFEDYQKISAELEEIIIRTPRECSERQICASGSACALNLAYYPILCERTSNIDLKTFRPELTMTIDFMHFIESVFGKTGLFYLYSSEKELMYIGSAENIGSKILEVIWEKNIDGYVAISFLDNLADMCIYESYLRITEKPLLNTSFHFSMSPQISMVAPEKSELVRIFER